MKEEKHMIKELAKAKVRVVVTWVVAILLVVLLIAAFFYGRKLGGAEAAALVQEKKTVTEDVLHQQLEAIGELNTVKYYYTNMGKYEKNLSLSGQNIPFTKTSFIITYDGVIKAGVELGGIQFAVKDKTVTITLPEPVILSHEVNEDSVQVFDEKNSIFNGLTTADVTEFQSQQKKIMEEKALANGILTEAEENAKDALTSLYRVFLASEDYEEGYILEFQLQQGES